MPLALGAQTRETLEEQQTHLLEETWLARNFDGILAETKKGKSFFPVGAGSSSPPTADRDAGARVDADTGAGALLPKAAPPTVATASLASSSKARVKPEGLVFEQILPTLVENPTDAPTNYKIRAIQYARAALYCIEKEAKAGINISDIRKKINEFLAILSDQSRAPNEKLNSNFNTFFIFLAKEIEKALGISYKEAEKKLRLAEQLLTWKEGRTSITNTSYTTINGTRYRIIQEEEPITTLTEAQKTEYRAAIRETNQHKWFRDLDPLLRDYIQEQVRENNWIAIACIPASLRSVPGLANFVRINITIKELNNEAGTAVVNTIKHTQYRSATPVPIDMKGSEERIQITALNLEQLIEQKLDDRLRIAFEEKNLTKTKEVLTDTTKNNGLTVENFSTLKLALKASVLEKIKAVNTLERARTGKNNYKFPVNLNSLLTEIWGAGLYPSKDNNSRLLKEIKAGSAKLKEGSSIYNELDLSVSNISINSLRWLFLAINKDNYEDDKIYLDYCETNLDSKADTPPEKKKRLLEAGKALKALQYKSDYFGDLNLMRAALRSIIIEGDDSACKSGKDRAGILTIYATALLAYYARHGEFPDLNLPRKLGLFFSATRYLGFVSMAFAVTSIIAFLEFGGILIMPLPAIIALASVGLALVLVGTIRRIIDLRSISSDNRDTHRNFLQIVRHLFLTGFVQKSASLNAPGAEGVQDPDILPDALTNTVLAERPLGKLADKPLRKANLILSLVLAGALATGAHFILIAYTVAVSASVALALNWLVPAVPIALVAAYLIIKLVETAAIPSLKSPKDKDEIEARTKFKKEKEVDGKLAKTNKPLGQRPSLRKAATPFLILAITLTVAIVLLHTFVAPIPVVAAILSIEVFNAICSVGAIALFVAALLLYLKVYVPRAADAQVRVLEELGSSLAEKAGTTLESTSASGMSIGGEARRLDRTTKLVRETGKSESEDGEFRVIRNPTGVETPPTSP